MARLFALVNVAMADAGIIAWREKYIHNFWRPVLGIREHDTSMGPAATVGSAGIDPDCDSGWLPLGAPKTNGLGLKNFTPPFPAYPSGHATFGAAALHITRLFYKVLPGDCGPDTVLQDQAGNDLTIVSDEFNGVNMDNHGTVRPRHLRSFPGGLWDMIIENGLSRVDLGVHWIFDAFGFTKDVNGKLQPDLTLPEKIGGVPLGIDIAEDIFNGGRAAGMKRAVAAPAPVAAEAAPEAAAEIAPGAVTERVGRERKRIPYLPN
jgi:vanadium chloroperoxidase